MQTAGCGTGSFVVLNPSVQELAANASLQGAHLGLHLERGFRVAPGNVNRNNNTIIPLVLLFFLQYHLCAMSMQPTGSTRLFFLSWPRTLVSENQTSKAKQWDKGLCLCHAKNSFLRQVERR